MHFSIASRWRALALPLLCLPALVAQDLPNPGGAAAHRDAVFDTVLHDARDGVHWACGRDWKASFDRGGFTFVPCFGARAPRNFPLAFEVAAVRVGGRDLAFARDVAPTVAGDRITFARGVLHEVYDTTPAHVAQSFVVDTTLPGDVEVELRVRSELRDDPDRPGLQFANQHGAVDYGDAFLVRGAERLPIATTLAGERLCLRVPGALRDGGPVVIDPVLSTSVADYLWSLVFTTDFPDLAFDPTFERYLAVWERAVSAADRDVFSQMFEADGNVLANSGAVIDISPVDCRKPRVANLASPGRFLVVYERTNPGEWGGRSMIYGRIRQADGLTPLQPEVAISQPNWNGTNSTPDVGGDPSPTPTANGWLVVWTHTFQGVGTIHRRAMRGDGVMIAPDDELARETGKPLYSPQVSLSNGNGRVPTPGWLVVFSRQDAAADPDVTGVFVRLDLVASPMIALDHSSAIDYFAFVTSPATDAAGSATRFLITFERQLPQSARAVVYDATANQVVGATNLTGTFGIGPFWTRGDSDGTRFVVAASVGTSSQNVAASTLVFDGQALVAHELNASLPGLVSFPQVVANGGAGGAANQYAVVYTDGSTNPVRTRLTRYGGHTPGQQFARRLLGCHGLIANEAGNTLLGGEAHFALANVGSALPGFAIGAPAPATPLCASCSVGFRLDQPIFLELGSANFTLAIPADIGLVGLRLTVQGLAIGGGTCLGNLALSDAFDLTIR